MVNGDSTKTTIGDIERYIYRNVMVYAIVAAIVTVLLLLAVILFPRFKGYAVFVVTAEVFLVVMLLYLVIYANHVLTEFNRGFENRGRMKLKVDKCPDFFTSKRLPGGEKVCVNGVSTPDTGYAFKFMGTASRPVPQEVNLDLVDGKRLDYVCAVVNPSVQSSEFYNIPWTSVRPKCRTGRVDNDDIGETAECEGRTGFVYTEDDK